MSSGEWLIAGVNAATAAIFINSGVTKLVSPGQLRRAVAEMLPPISEIAVPAVLRGLALAELVVAVALIVSPTRLPAAVAAAVLGTCFAAIGVLGLARRSIVPCGCFGASSRRPFGVVNIVAGLALVLVLPANLASVQAASGSTYTVGAVLATPIASIVLCLCLNRRLLAEFLPRGRAAPAGSEVG